MAKRTIAKLFRNGRSQAVRIPQEFRFEADHVSIRRVLTGILLEPLKFNVQEWFAKIDRIKAEPFMKEGRNQPRMPRRKIFK